MSTMGTVYYGRTTSVNYISQVVGSEELNPKVKTELLLKLTGKRKTLTNNCLAMMRHPELAESFDEVLRTFRYKVVNPENLGFVENALQKLSEVIKKSNVPNEQKSSFMFTSQSIQMQLSDVQFENQENNYMPNILQDYFQMILKGASKGIPVDKLDAVVYSDKYQDKNDPLMANFKYLDSNKVNEVNNILDDKTNRRSVTLQEEILGRTVIETKPQQVIQNSATFVNKKVVNIDTDFKEISHAEKSQFIGKMFAKCDKEDLRNVFNHDWENGQVDTKWTVSMKNVFNFVKDTLTVGNPNEVSYTNIHKAVKLFMRYGLEVGHSLQQESMRQQVVEKGEERTI